MPSSQTTLQSSHRYTVSCHCNPPAAEQRAQGVARPRRTSNGGPTARRSEPRAPQQLPEQADFEPPPPVPLGRFSAGSLLLRRTSSVVTDGEHGESPMVRFLVAGSNPFEPEHEPGTRLHGRQGSVT